MSRIQKITLTFDVYEDDMPSERRAQYRQAVIDAMARYKEDVEQAIDEIGEDQVDPDAAANIVLIDKMLEDRNR
jgi:hypothetical protein